jgi:hypothetical protein
LEIKVNENTLEFVTSLLSQKRKIHITPREKCIIKALFYEQTYQQAGKEYGYSEGTLQNAASKLFKDFSQIFDREINRRNCKAVLSEVIGTVDRRSILPAKEQIAINVDLWMHKNHCRVIIIDPSKNADSTKILQSCFNNYYSHFRSAIWLDLKLFSSIGSFLIELINMIGPVIDLTYHNVDQLLDLLIERMNYQRCLIAVECGDLQLAGDCNSCNQVLVTVASKIHNSLLISNCNWQQCSLEPLQNNPHRLSIKTTDVEYLGIIQNLAFASS